MATISQYRCKWKVQVRKEGYPAQTRTFPLRAEAIAWGNEVEAQINRQAFAGSTTTQTMTVQEMLDRYLREESPKKASGKTDTSRSKPLGEALGQFRVHTLPSTRIAQYKVDRLADVSPQTVTHEPNLLHRAYVIAANEWGIVLPNGIPRTKRPSLPRGRDYTDRRRRQQQGIAKRNEAIIAMLRKGDSWNHILDATGCSRSTLSRLAQRVKASV